MKRGENGDKIIREVIRGERPWTDLRSAGIEVQLQGDRFHIENPHQARAAADIHDLAQGLIAHLKELGFHNFTPLRKNPRIVPPLRLPSVRARKPERIAPRSPRACRPCDP